MGTETVSTYVKQFGNHYGAIDESINIDYPKFDKSVPSHLTLSMEKVNEHVPNCVTLPVSNHSFKSSLWGKYLTSMRPTSSIFVNLFNFLAGDTLLNETSLERSA